MVSCFHFILFQCQNHMSALEKFKKEKKKKKFKKRKTTNFVIEGKIFIILSPNRNYADFISTTSFLVTSSLSELCSLKIALDLLF